jgi:mono/diheme cytochrome c family protein
MTFVKILLGLLAAAVLYLVILVSFPDEVLTYAPQIVPGKLVPLLPPPLPKTPAPKTAYWLDQNWRLEDRLWVHHASQGTKTFPIPYAWFVALEQPYIAWIGEPGLLRDSAYLQRLGFIPSPRTGASPAELRDFGFGWSKAPEPPAIAPSTSLAWSAAKNDDGLPVGFARLQGAKDPATGAVDAGSDLIGLTCAACHTGHVEYKGVTLRIDGGPAMADLGKLQSVLGLSVAYTLVIPGRFDRFAARVLGAGADDGQKAALQKTLTQTFDGMKAAGTRQFQIIEARGQKATLEGAGRLDAINRIGNQVFYTDMAGAKLAELDDNFHANDAPVSFPPIWNVPWFLWAQYDATIEHPLIRNAGEALGVAAPVDLADSAGSKNLYRSSVAFANLLWIEDLLRGPDPFAGGQQRKGFGGLAAPKWPAALFPEDPAWKIDPQKVARGRALYAELCAGCHLGPIDDPAFDEAYPAKQFWTSKHWITLGGKDGNKGEKLLLAPQIPADEIATDRTRADVLVTRMVETPAALDLNPQRDIGERWGCEAAIPAFKTPRIPFALALMIVVDNVTRKWMDEENISPADRAAIFGARKNCPNPGENQPFYRTRPLNGVWATAPYLHNGSVPSLYWLLRPAAERPSQFCVGASDFDPKTVGFPANASAKPGCAVGETLFTTRDENDAVLTGNGTGGHSFENAKAKGVIGRGLNDGERYDLIEYLKTL